MKRKEVKLLFICFLFAIINFISSMVLQAEESPSYRITPVLPENQNENTRGFFDLNVVTGEKEILTLRIKNLTAEKMILHAFTGNAYTASNGGIEYASSENKKSDAWSDALIEEYKLENYLKINKEVVLKPYEEKTLEFEFIVPEIKGEILGAVLFKEIKSDKEEEGGFQTKNEVIMGIGVKLNLPEKEQNKMLEITEVRVLQLPSGTRLNIKVQNKSAKILENVKGEYIVYKEDRQLLSGTFEQEELAIKMAPKTTMNFSIPWTNERFEQKKNYKVQVTISNGESSVTTIKEIQISKEELKEHKKDQENKLTVQEINNEESFIWKYVGILVMVLLLFIFWKKKKKKNEVWVLKEEFEKLEKEEKEE